MRRSIRFPIILAVMILPAACQTAVSDSCGALFAYSRAFEAQAAQEYGTLPPASKKMIDDYKITRDTIRDCVNPKP